MPVTETATPTPNADEPMLTVPKAILEEIFKKISAISEASYKSHFEFGQAVLSNFAKLLDTEASGKNLMVANVYRQVASLARQAGAFIREESQR